MTAAGFRGESAASSRPEIRRTAHRPVPRRRRSSAWRASENPDGWWPRRLFFSLPDVLLWFIARSRSRPVPRPADALDLMVVCVEAGLGLDQRCGRSPRNAEDLPGDRREFGIANFQLQMGSARNEVLMSWGRTGVSDLRSRPPSLSSRQVRSAWQALRVQSVRCARRADGREGRQDGRQIDHPPVLFIFPASSWSSSAPPPCRWSRFAC